MKTILMDGYNVIYSISAFEKTLKTSLRYAREVLIQTCAHYAEKRGDIQRFYIVFDGRDEFADLPTEHLGKITVLFSNTSEEADGKIIEILNDKARRGEWWVVSKDNYVTNNARSLTAKFITPQDFFEWIIPNAKASASIQSSRKSISESSAKEITEIYKKHLGIK